MFRILQTMNTTTTDAKGPKVPRPRVRFHDGDSFTFVYCPLLHHNSSN